MRGALLRSGKIEDYDALGEAGTPVHRMALQLREAARRKGPDLVDHLAIPQINQAGDSIDWYAPKSGPVIPWSAATEEERIPARAQMEALKAGLQAVSAKLLASNTDTPDSDTALFAKLLNRVSYFPDESYVYLVDGSPVVTFWGFDHIGSDRKRNPLLCLYAPPSSPVAQEDHAADRARGHPDRAASRRNGRQPLVEALVVAAVAALAAAVVAGTQGLRARRTPPDAGRPRLAFMAAIRGVAPALHAPGFDVSSGAPGASLSLHEAPAPAMPDQTVAPPLSQDTAVPNPDQGQAAQDPDAASTAQTEPAETIPEPPGNTDTPAEPATPLSIETVDTPAATPPAPPGALSLPPDLPNGPADFLNGHWRAGAGIQDAQTGKPLRLEYQFEDGKGQATVTRDNAFCQGPVSAAVQAGALQIIPDGQARCSDGGQYELPEIQCKPGATTTADCAGHYGDMRFPLSMRQAGG
ncbi:hypothetical protein CDEN61S_02020 [Castellaniella denitrificans]